MTSKIPVNSTPFELAVEEALDYGDKFKNALRSITGFKSLRPLPDGFGPFIVWENGLSSISQFFNTSEEVLDNGLPWIDLRETPDGIIRALSWIGYANPLLEDQNVGRRNWNRYQIAIGALPGEQETQKLLDAEYLADLSDNARDVFFRGYHGYDVRPLTASGGKAGHNLASGISGVKVDGGTVIWSHGEDHVLNAIASLSEKATLGVDYTQGQDIEWEDIPWDAPGISWDGIDNVAEFKSWAILKLNAYIVFFDSSDEVIGARRVGNWKEHVSISGDDATIKFECRTGFGDGGGKSVASCGVLFFSSNVDAAKPGRQWLEPEEISISNNLTVLQATVGKTPISLDFRETVRVKIDFNLTI